MALTVGRDKARVKAFVELLPDWRSLPRKTPCAIPVLVSCTEAVALRRRELEKLRTVVTVVPNLDSKEVRVVVACDVARLPVVVYIVPANLD